jgi:hypothetical protein
VTETPQDKLTRAAELIRERAGKASPGPWNHDPNSTGEWSVYGAGGWLVASAVAYDGGVARMPDPRSDRVHPPERIDSTANAAWIALMSPDVAPHIAAWLERSAEDYRAERKAQSKWPPGGYTMLLPDDFDAAVAFADLILGSAT